MPKMKTHKGAKRRFKISAGGKILQQQGVRGNKVNRAKRARRKYGKDLAASESNRHNLAVALPYAKL